MSQELIKDLESMIEEWGDKAFDNAAEITAIFISIKQEINLTEYQVELCYKLKSETGNQLFDDLLEANAINKSKISKISGYVNLATKLNNVVDLAQNVTDIFGLVQKYISDGEVSVAEAMSKSLSTLNSTLEIISCSDWVSSMLSVAIDLLDKGTELVLQRVELYNQLDAVLESVMNGTSSDAEETQVKDMYATVKAFEESGCSDAIRLYQSLLNQYGWIFDLAGIDTTQLYEYNTSMTAIQSAYNDLSSKMKEIEKIDIDHDGIISNQEIEINVHQIETAEKSQRYDPLILDLNKNGKFTSYTENSVHFDYSGDGFAEKTTWVEEGDGLLVYDKNGNGTIDDGTELFGDKTIMQNGSVASNGFAALGDLDSNGDQKISSEDTLFDQLQVWMDTNNDGISQQEELYTLSDLGIKELSISTKAYNTTDENGNIVARKSSFTYEDGTVGDIAELNFDISSSDTVSKNEIEVSEEIKNGYPQLIPSGNMLNLHEAMSIDEELYKLVQEFVNEDEMHNLEKATSNL